MIYNCMSSHPFYDYILYGSLNTHKALTYSNSTVWEPFSVKGMVLWEQVKELEHASLVGKTLILLKCTHNHLTKVVMLHWAQQALLEELLQPNVTPVYVCVYMYQYMTKDMYYVGSYGTYTNVCTGLSSTHCTLSAVPTDMKWASCQLVCTSRR